MIYVYEINTTTDYPSTNKLKTILKMQMGIIYKIEISFPPGSAGNLHIQICDALHQVWPTNEGADFAGDNVEIEFDDEYPLIQPPYELECFTWNTDTLWDHVLYLRLGIKAVSGVYYLSAEELAALSAE